MELVVSGMKLLHDFGAITLTPEQAENAALYVAANSNDTDDCRELLQALGLIR